MNDYNKSIELLQNPTFQRIICIARENLPIEKSTKPWSSINHGLDILQTEYELNCYLSAYGEMHEAKIKTALCAIPNFRQVFNNSLEIVDWGCGQGLATVCFFDFLKQQNIPNRIQKVTLIEPSEMALKRAILHVNSYLNADNKTIRIVNKYIADVTKSDIENKQQISLHFFSNILDISTIDLKKLAALVGDNIVGEHYFFCVGPLNFNSTRIEEFAKHLNITDEQLIEHKHGQLTNTRGTIKLLVFKIIGKEIEVIKTDFYPPIPNNINHITMIEKIIKRIDPTHLNETDKIIHFYKTIVELEQQKEPEINEFYQYPINDAFSIDLTQNNVFIQKFNDNKNPAITKWPKDLFVGLRINLNDNLYTLMNYIIPFSDVKDIDPNTQQIPWKLSDFSINLKAFEKLEFSEEQITEIEEAIKEQSTIAGISSVLKTKIDDNIILNEILYLALSSKNPALSQIYSELNKLNSNNIIKESLLESFLTNKKIDNQVLNLQEEDLIQISDIDDSQKKAVLNAFNNKLSVITGPPGSGKTQVILNILANSTLPN